MIDQRFMAANSMPVPDSDGNGPTADPRVPLEERIGRLEDAVASLQDTRRLEERVVERVAERIGREPAAAPPPAPGLLVEAGRRLLPAAVAVVASHAEAEPVADPPGPVARPAWLLVEIYYEWRAIVGMFLDRRRFRVSWSASLIPLGAVFLMGFVWLVFAGRFWFLGDVVCWVVDMVLILVAYKALSREAARYRATVGPPTALPVNRDSRIGYGIHTDEVKTA